ncbi:hypothetical protein Aple_042550 [Acrocarpospora pleiomorpha]|uniref:Very short patch repair endonuclease n=1 Tax=Acrocarpospora pleiomorpha TaxID=90975 RepID=A0A5M3XMJ9_9ACTN|nr:hypothetical protein Aple_042550 [Acrocarpospora pleiomorpha]
MSPTERQDAGRWKKDSPPDSAWRPKPNLPRSARTTEQDRAAGGSNRRRVDLGDGRVAQASVELKLPRGARRIRANLRWSNAGRTEFEYLGEVEESTRARNLAAAWKIAISQGLVLPHDHALADKSWASSHAVRASMRGNRRKDTKPELALRKAIHSLGLRYRVDTEPIKGFRRRADIVFGRIKVAVFSDGCFWHGCPDHYRASHENNQYWNDKFARNQARDRDTDRVLTDAGWLVIRVWEHESPHEAAERIAEAVTSRRDI